MIATFKSTESRYSTAKDSHAYSQATAYAKMRAAQGWAKGVELISSYNNTTVSGYLNVRPQRLNN